MNKFLSHFLAFGVGTFIAHDVTILLLRKYYVLEKKTSLPKNILGQKVSVVDEEYYILRDAIEDALENIPRGKWIAKFNPETVFEWETYKDHKFNGQDLWVCMVAFQKKYGDDHLDMAKAIAEAVQGRKDLDYRTDYKTAGFRAPMDYLLSIATVNCLLYLEDREWYREHLETRK